MLTSADAAPIAVIGAGVAGLTSAAALLDHGYAVTVYEQAQQPGRGGCSWWAGGMLAPYCEAVSAGTMVLERGLGAADWWSAHGAQVHRCGSLVLALASERQELLQFAQRSQGHQWLDHAAIAELEPDLAARATQGLWFADEAHLDPRQSLPALAAYLAERGVGFEFGHPITAEAWPAPTVVDCRGLAARDALTELRGVRGERVLIRSRDLHLRRPVRLLHPRLPLYLIPRDDGVIMLGATSIESDHSGPISVRSVLELLTAAVHLHPALAEAEVLEYGVGVRPAFADHLPRIKTQGRRLYFNGLYRHGYLLAPWYAQSLAVHVTALHEVRHEA